MKINRSLLTNFNPDNDVTFYQNVTAESLSGTGTRMVVANSAGLLSTQAIPSGTIGGSGTANYVPKFATSTSLGNSLIYDDGTNIGIGTTTPTSLLQINAATSVSSNQTFAKFGRTTGANDGFGDYIGIGPNAVTQIASVYRSGTNSWGLEFLTNTGSTNVLRLNALGNVLINSITDSGERLQVTGTTRLTGNTLIVGNATVGQISNNSTNASLDITAGGGGYNAWVDFGFYGTFDASIYRVGYYGDDSGKFKINYTGGGPVEEVLSINSSKTTTINYNLVVDTDTLYVDATNNRVGIGTASPSEKLVVNGNIKTASPSGGTAKPWKLGAAASATGDTQNTKIEVEIDGVLYYLIAYTV